MRWWRRLIGGTIADNAGNFVGERIRLGNAVERSIGLRASSSSPFDLDAAKHVFESSSSSSAYLVKAPTA